MSHDINDSATKEWPAQGRDIFNAAKARFRIHYAHNMLMNRSVDIRLLLCWTHRGLATEALARKTTWVPRKAWRWWWSGNEVRLF